MALTTPHDHATITRRRLIRWMTVLGLLTAIGVAPGAAAPASHGARVTGDEPQYLMTAISLGEDGDLDIADERAEKRWRPFHEVGPPLVQEEVTGDGRRVSPHDPLLPAVLAFPVRLGGWVAGKLVLAGMAGALAAALLWVAVRRLGIPLRPAALAVGVFSLSAPLAVYGTQVYPELPAALVLTLGLAAALGPPRRAGAVGTVAAVVALPWLSVKYVPVAAALALVAGARLTRAGQWRLVVGAGIGLVAAGVAYLVAHHAWYGGWTVYAAGDHFVGGEATVMGHDPDYAGRSVRLLGLLTDRDFGLVVWQPAFLLAVPALAALMRRRAPGSGSLAVVLGAGWLTATFVALTMHGWWWPGRQVVVVLPVVVLVTGWWISQTAARARVMAILGVAGILTFGGLLVEAIAGDLTLVVDFDATVNPLVRALQPLLPNYRELSGATWARHFLWILAVAALAVWGWRSGVTPRPAVRDMHRVRDLRRVPTLTTSSH